MTRRERIMREPHASRVLMIGAGSVSLAFAALTIWSKGQHGYAFAVSAGYLVVVLMIAGFSIIGLISLGRSGQRRPGRFTVSNGSFQVDPLLSPAIVAIGPMVTASLFTGMVVNAWTDLPSEDPLDYAFAAGMTVMVVIMVALSIVSAAVFGWRRILPVEFTPDGIRTRTPLFRRIIPWEALAAGGPPRPAPNAKMLGLIAARPDLVVQRGPAFLAGPPGRPVLAVDGNVNPWFVADAIRWYVEHPDDRAAIGTQTEHDRLVAELGWAGYSQQRG